MDQPEQRPIRFFRLTLIVVGVGLGYALRWIFGPPDNGSGDRTFRLPDRQVSAVRVSADNASTDTAPTDTAPTDTAPTDTAPTDTAPTDAPKVTDAPKADAPKEDVNSTEFGE